MVRGLDRKPSNKAHRSYRQVQNLATLVLLQGFRPITTVRAFRVLSLEAYLPDVTKSRVRERPTLVSWRDEKVHTGLPLSSSLSRSSQVRRQSREEVLFDEPWTASGKQEKHASPSFTKGRGVLDSIFTTAMSARVSKLITCT
jgi:hypothetical protein